MSRYDWSKAPDWARFAATDEGGPDVHHRGDDRDRRLRQDIWRLKSTA